MISSMTTGTQSEGPAIVREGNGTTKPVSVQIAKVVMVDTIPSISGVDIVPGGQREDSHVPRLIISIEANRKSIAVRSEVYTPP